LALGGQGTIISHSVEWQEHKAGSNVYVRCWLPCLHALTDPDCFSTAPSHAKFVSHQIQPITKMSSLEPVLASNSTNANVSKFAGQSASAFAASLVVSIIIFTVEAGLFVLIKDRFSRI
jgi:hypothetical protein